MNTKSPGKSKTYHFLGSHPIFLEGLIGYSVKFVVHHSDFDGDFIESEVCKYNYLSSHSLPNSSFFR